MNSELDKFLTTFLHSDREDCGAERVCLIDLFERSSRNMTIGGYDDPEDYYRQNVPVNLLAIELNDAVQLEIINRIINRMREVPEREDLLFLMCKLRLHLLFQPVLEIVSELSDRFGLFSSQSALLALQDVLGWPEEGYGVKEELLAFNKLDKIKNFIYHSTLSDQTDLKDTAEWTKKYFEANGITFEDIS